MGTDIAPGAERHHRAHCEGHIHCPNCGPESCTKVVTWVGPGRVPHTVVCLTCYRRFGVWDGTEDDGNKGG